MNIESTTDPIVYRMIKRDELKIQLATVIGVIVGAVAYILILLAFRLYRYLALFLGTWREPSGIDVAVAVLASPLLIILIVAIVRWLLIYKWIARE